MPDSSPDHHAREAWSRVLEIARGQLSETTVVMWFADVRPVELSDDVLVLAVPSARRTLAQPSLSDRRRRAGVGAPVKIEFRSRTVCVTR
jgi:hypothetical protein